VLELTRTFLFVPGDRPDMLAKAGQRGADAVIADLEDAVAPSNKETAQATIGEWLTHDWDQRCGRWIRINGGRDGIADLGALEGRRFDGLMIPKVSAAAELAEWAQRIEAVQGDCPLLVLIESAGALRALDEIATHRNTHQLMIGEADLGADIGLPADSPIWDSLRADVVVASAAAGLPAPIGPVNPDYSSPATIEAETRRLKAMGFGARAIIHPAQIEPVHRAFRPSPTALTAARRLIAAHERALAAGQGVHVDESGKMVDEAFVRRARDVVARATQYEDAG